MYTIEGKESFHNILQNAADEDKACLISKDPLEAHAITLPCSHTFNYLAIYRSVLKEKISQPKQKQIKCPYCRVAHNGVLPYYDRVGVSKLAGVNSGGNILPCFTCEWVYLCGKKKGEKCTSCANALSHGFYCKTHARQTMLQKTSHPICGAILKTKPGQTCQSRAHANGYCKVHCPQVAP